MTEEKKTKEEEQPLFNEKYEDELVRKMLLAALDTNDKSNNWKISKTNDDNLTIEYCFLQDGNNKDSLATIRASSIISGVTPEKYYEYLEAAPDRIDIFNVEKKLDSMCKILRCHHYINKDRQIIYGKYDSGFGFVISPRDFVYMKRRILLKNYKLSNDTYNSISMDLCYSIDKNHKYYMKNTSGSVRGTLKFGAFIFSSLPNTNKTKITYIVKLNPEGWIPLWVANLVAPEQGLVCKNLRENINLINLVLNQRKQLTSNQNNKDNKPKDNNDNNDNNDNQDIIQNNKNNIQNEEKQNKQNNQTQTN